MASTTEMTVTRMATIMAVMAAMTESIMATTITAAASIIMASTITAMVREITARITRVIRTIMAAREIVQIMAARM